MVSRLSSLPSGPRFRRLHLTLNQQKDALPVTALVKSCHRTLKYLEITNQTEHFQRVPFEVVDLTQHIGVTGLSSQSS